MKKLMLGPAILAVVAGLALGRTASGTSSQPPLTIGTATGQVFAGGPNVTLQPDASPPTIDAQEALSDALGGPFGDTATAAEAIYGLAVPRPGLGMLGSPTPVWAIIETNPCVPRLGPGEGAGQGPPCDQGGRAVVFIDAQSGENLGQETIGASVPPASRKPGDLRMSDVLAFIAQR